jgi:hypothetical protein
MKVGGREVVQSGCVVTQRGDKQLELLIENLEFRLVFEQREPPKADIKGEIDGTRLVLTLFNFGGPFMTTWSGVVGTLFAKRLHLALAVNATADDQGTTYSVNYTFSTEAD